jgi:ABC-2 type transport system ATP-binding protein
MRDVEELTDRIILISKGHIKFDGSKHQLKRRWHNERRIRVIYRKPKTRTWRRQLREIAGVTNLEVTNGQFELTINQDQIPVPAILKLILDLVTIEDIEVKEPNLEDIIRGIFGEDQFQSTTNPQEEPG